MGGNAFWMPPACFSQSASSGYTSPCDHRRVCRLLHTSWEHHHEVAKVDKQVIRPEVEKRGQENGNRQCWKRFVEHSEQEERTSETLQKQSQTCQSESTCNKDTSLHTHHHNANECCRERREVKNCSTSNQHTIENEIAQAELDGFVYRKEDACACYRHKTTERRRCSAHCTNTHLLHLLQRQRDAWHLVELEQRTAFRQSTSKHGTCGRSRAIGDLAWRKTSLRPAALSRRPLG